MFLRMTSMSVSVREELETMERRAIELFEKMLPIVEEFSVHFTVRDEVGGYIQRALTIREDGLVTLIWDYQEFPSPHAALFV